MFRIPVKLLEVLIYDWFHVNLVQNQAVCNEKQYRYLFPLVTFMSPGWLIWRSKHNVICVVNALIVMTIRSTVLWSPDRRSSTLVSPRWITENCILICQTIDWVIMIKLPDLKCPHDRLSLRYKAWRSSIWRSKYRRPYTIIRLTLLCLRRKAC